MDEVLYEWADRCAVNVHADRWAVNVHTTN
jgi:hypothetical protein